MGKTLSGKDENRVSKALHAFERSVPAVIQTPSRTPRATSNSAKIKIGVAAEDIPIDESGLVTVWNDSVTPPIATSEVITAHLDWLHNETAVSTGDELLLFLFGGIWRIVRPGVGNTDSDNGEYNCCGCSKSKLYFYVENSTTITAKKVAFPKSIVTSGSIVHQLEVTCLADGATAIVTLPALDCESTDCQTADFSDTYVGGCLIGEIKYGNDQSCGVNAICPAWIASPYDHQFTEDMSGLPGTWTTTKTTTESPSISSGKLLLYSPETPSYMSLQSPAAFPKNKNSTFYLETSIDATEGAGDFDIGNISVSVFFGGDSIGCVSRNEFGSRIVGFRGIIGGSVNWLFQQPETGEHTFTIIIEGDSIVCRLDGSPVYSRPYIRTDVCGSQIAIVASLSTGTVQGSPAATSSTEARINYINHGWTP